MTATAPSPHSPQPSTEASSLAAADSTLDSPDSARRPVVIMLMGCLLVTMGTAWFARTNQGTAAVGAPYGTLNPNQAPWHELALLPRIGESKARAIVAHRRATDRGEPVTAFKEADDLQHVSGIGPKTVQRLAPELRFKD